MSETMPRIRRSLIVGIGGSGSLAALHAKKALIQFYGVVPYAVKFLVLDTDARSPIPLKARLIGKQPQKVEMEDYEYLYLAVKDPLNVIDLSPAIQSWWPEGIPTKAILNGAGGYRARGRLAFFNHADNVQRHVRQTVEGLLAGDLSHRMRQEQKLELVQEGVEIYVVCSLAGGTGSGSFLDTGFLFRKAFETIQNRLVGFFIMPSVFEGLPATSRVNINGYAALKELEYYMDLDYHKDKPKFMFGRTEFQPDRPPYDVINLMDGIQENGQVIPSKGSDKGVENLSRLVGEGIALNIGNIGQRAESACDNLYDHIVSQSRQEWGGKSPHYSTIGVSSIIYPIEKHYSQLSSYYAYGLIDGLFHMIKGIDLIPEKEVEEDVDKFLTETKLEKTSMIEDVLSSESLHFNPSAEGLSSPEQINDEEKRELQRRDALKAQLEQDIPGKIKARKNEANRFLESRKNTKGIIYARKAAEKLAARFSYYRDEILEIIQQYESKLATRQQSARQYFDESVKAIGFTDRILGRRGQIFQDYLDQVAGLLGLSLDIERHRKALSLINDLVKSVNQYIEGLDLGGLEKKLSDIRKLIEADYFGTSQLVDAYGQYSLILHPKIIYTKQENEGERIPVGKDREIVELPTDFEKFSISPPEPEDLLEAYSLNISDLERMDDKDLKEKIMLYAGNKVSSIKDVDVEKILTLEKEGTEYWLKEASSRATPLWQHNAAAELAAMMEEIFIVGISDEYKTTLPVDKLKGKYYPTLMSTADPYKIFLFKYKAPLPAYLLPNMIRCRSSYLSTALEYTPHIGKNMEFYLPSLQPERKTQKLLLPVYILAMAINYIKEERFSDTFMIDDQRCLNPGEKRIELGYPAWRVFEEIKRPERQKLVNLLLELLKNDIDTAVERIQEALHNYYQKLKEAFDQRNSSMSLGDAILLSKQIKFLDEFYQAGGDIKGLIG